MPATSLMSSSLAYFTTSGMSEVFSAAIDADGYVIDAKGNKAKLPRGSSDAALLPYHVDRSKLFVIYRLAKMEMLDAARIAHAIEFTRFPSHRPTTMTAKRACLVRAADLIGQLGDPHYLRKANALYYEFEEVGMNKQLGYASPADLTDRYPQFYWSNISPHIQEAIRYLNVTSSGRQWIDNLYSNFFAPSATSACPVRNDETGVQQLVKLSLGGGMSAEGQRRTLMGFAVR